MSKSTTNQKIECLLQWQVSKGQMRYVVGMGYVKIKPKFERIKEEIDEN